MTVPELIKALELEVTGDGFELLTRLKEAVGFEVWPEKTFAAAQEAFGRGVYADNGRTRKNLDRRIRHARRVWWDKYGPFTPDQELYIDVVLSSAIRSGQRDAAAGKGGTIYANVQAQITRMVNHERVHEGFLSRAEERIDVSDELRELVAA